MIDFFLFLALLFQKEIKAKTEMSWVNATEIDKDTDIFKQKAGQVSIFIIQLSFLLLKKTLFRL